MSLLGWPRSSVYAFGDSDLQPARPARVSQLVGGIKGQLSPASPRRFWIYNFKCSNFPLLLQLSFANSLTETDRQTDRQTDRLLRRVVHVNEA